VRDSDGTLIVAKPPFRAGQARHHGSPDDWKDPAWFFTPTTLERWKPCMHGFTTTTLMC
tara:strand:- start:10872 stop:11048 length:177 start_codon:yes stop_codon:yes gene_type:complete